MSKKTYWYCSSWLYPFTDTLEMSTQCSQTTDTDPINATGRWVMGKKLRRHDGRRSMSRGVRTDPKRNWPNSVIERHGQSLANPLDMCMANSILPLNSTWPKIRFCGQAGTGLLTVWGQWLCSKDWAASRAEGLPLIGWNSLTAMLACGGRAWCRKWSSKYWQQQGQHCWRIGPKTSPNWL